MPYFVEAYSPFNPVGQQLQHLGEFEGQPEAIAAAKRLIDDFLQQECKPGMTADTLFGHYQTFGQVPCVLRSDGKTIGNTGFSALDYAKTRSAELCATG
ncbi:MAG: hypothetical protein ACREUW_02740 [Burkholderiales bacterium]